MVSEKTMLVYIYGTPIRAALAERSKVNLDLWNLFIAIVALDKTYQVRKRLWLQQFSKNQLFKNFPIQMLLGSKFDPDVK